MKTKRILLVGGSGISDYYRLIVPGRELTDRGYSVDFYDPNREEDFPKGQYDLIMIERVVPRGNISGHVLQYKQDGVKIVVDLDDDLKKIPRHNPAYHQVGPGNPIAIQELEMLLYLSDALVFTHDVLRKRYEVYNHRTFVIPNGFYDNSPFWEREHKCKNGITIGIGGTTTHSKDYEMIQETLEAICNEMDHVGVMIYGDLSFYLSLRVPDKRFIPFINADLYPWALGYSDIVLAPLELDTFNEAKSDIKLVHAGARRIPWIASPIHFYKEWGAGGIIAENNKEDWKSAMTTLINDSALRERLGSEGYEKSKSRRSSVLVENYISMIEELTS